MEAITNHADNQQFPKKVWIKSKDVLPMIPISLRTLLDWGKDGTLPRYKVKKRVFYDEAEVIAMMNSLKEKPLPVSIRKPRKKK